VAGRSDGGIGRRTKDDLNKMCSATHINRVPTGKGLQVRILFRSRYPNKIADMVTGKYADG